MSKSAESLPEEFIVCSLNVMHTSANSRLPPQPERLDDIAEIVRLLRPDAICKYEVQGEGAAETLAGKLDFPKWAYTPNGNKGSGILVAGGKDIDGFEPVPIDKETNRWAMIAHYFGSRALAAEHPDHYPIKGRAMRVRQNGELLAALIDIEEVVIAGDFNDTPGSPSRQLLKDQGFVSAFEDPPGTFPAKASIADIGVPKCFQELVRSLFRMGVKFSLDDIVARGLTIDEAQLISTIIKKDGQVTAVSDHLGVAAKLKKRR